MWVNFIPLIIVESLVFPCHLWGRDSGPPWQVFAFCGLVEMLTTFATWWGAPSNISFLRYGVPDWNWVPIFFGSNVGFSAEKGRPSTENKGNGYGSIPINTIFRGMNIHLPAILMFTRGTRFWHTAKWKHCPGQNQQRLQQTGPDSWECRLPWWASEVLKYSQVRRHI